MPPAESEKIIQHLCFEEHTPNTVKNKEELRKQMEMFKKQGYALDDEEIEEGLYCVAVPIFDAEYNMKVAISISGLKTRMLSKKRLVVKELLDLSLLLSKKLGYMKSV